MSDDLRTRIAAVLYSRRHYRLAGILIPEVSQKIALQAADAVIAELGLREETVTFANGPLNGFVGGPYAGCTGNGANRRYVTEWEPDD